MGRGGQTQGNSMFSLEPESNSPPLGTAFAQNRSSRPQGRTQMSNSPPWEKLAESIFPLSSPPPSPLLGLNIDSCIVSFARKGKITLLVIHELYFSLSEPI